MRIIILCLSLLLFPSVSNAAGIYTETVKRVGMIGDRHAINRIEAFVWGYGWSMHKEGCKPAKDYHFRRVAETAWLEIKYNANPSDNFINAVGDWVNKNYKCVRGQ